MSSNITDMRTRARKASIARVDAQAKGAVAFLRATDRLQAAQAEDDRQRKTHISQLDHAISASWIAPTMGPHLTEQAIKSICERLGAPREVSANSPLWGQLRGSLALLKKEPAADAEIRRFEAERAKAMIVAGVALLRDNSSDKEALEFLGDTMVCTGGM